MDTIGMDSYPFIAAAAAAVIVVPEQDRVLLVGCREANPSFGEDFSARRRPSNDGQTGRLRTSVRRAIILIIAQLLLAEIAPLVTTPETVYDHRG